MSRPKDPTQTAATDHCPLPRHIANLAPGRHCEHRTDQPGPGRRRENDSITGLKICPLENNRHGRLNRDGSRSVAVRPDACDMATTSAALQPLDGSHRLHLVPGRLGRQSFLLQQEPNSNSILAAPDHQPEPTLRGWASYSPHGKYRGCQQRRRLSPTPTASAKSCNACLLSAARSRTDRPRSCTPEPERLTVWRWQ